MHTETALLDYLLLQAFDLSGLHIGVSRICCPLCTLFVQAINQKCSDQEFIYTHGSHQNTPASWIFPEVLIQDKELLANFLGGTTSKLYSVFVYMNDGEKAIALKLIQGMNISILKDHLKQCPDLSELYKILVKPFSQHPLPEPSLTAVSEHVVLMDVNSDEVTSSGHASDLDEYGHV